MKVGKWSSKYLICYYKDCKMRSLRWFSNTVSCILRLLWHKNYSGFTKNVCLNAVLSENDQG